MIEIAPAWCNAPTASSAIPEFTLSNQNGKQNSGNFLALVLMYYELIEVAPSE